MGADAFLFLGFRFHRADAAREDEKRIVRGTISCRACGNGEIPTFWPARSVTMPQCRCIQFPSTGASLNPWAFLTQTFNLRQGLRLAVVADFDHAGRDQDDDAGYGRAG